jgi:hypothetical protein
VSLYQQGDNQNLDPRRDQHTDQNIGPFSASHGSSPEFASRPKKIGGRVYSAVPMRVQAGSIMMVSSQSSLSA